MSEKCPMSERRGFYWERDFPEVCRRVCGELIEKALSGPHGPVDMFEEECSWDDIEYSGTTLQGSPDSNIRDVAESYWCISHNTDAFAELRTFECPNN